MYRILVGSPWETYYKLETLTLNCFLKRRVWRCELNSLGCDKSPLVAAMNEVMNLWVYKDVVHVAS